MRTGNEPNEYGTADAVGMAGQPYLAVHDGSEGLALADEARSAGRLTVVARDLPVGATAPWQRMDGADLAYLVVAGRLELVLPDRTWVAEPLALVSCPRGTPHRYVARTAVRLVVIATPAGLEHFLVHGTRAAATDPALFLALAQEHRVEVLPDLLP